MKLIINVVASAALLAWVATETASADSDFGIAPRPTTAPTLTLSGYAELHASLYTYGPNQNRTGGSQRDVRLELDTTRLTLELEAALPGELELEAEVEFEHGGTGAAVELEYEEFGEFESEIEKGGEVLLEELYLRKVLGGRYALSVGRFYVAVGRLSRYYRPTAYLGTTRSEAETTVIPQVWDEMGIRLEAFMGRTKVTAQVVNGLDSTGFSSQYWVTTGHQRRFETVRATDLAGVLRADVQVRPGVEVGASAYVGGTSRNRPKPDLVPECPGGSADEVAPCGYVQAPLVITDVHAAFDVVGFRGSALALWGYLGNAGAVSTRNQRLSNELGVLRTPISDQALALSAELGWNAAPLLGTGAEHRLEPFVRIEYYDTVFQPREELFDNPRFARTVLAGGISYQLHGSAFAKLDVSHRSFASADFRPESAFRMATGLVF